METANNTDTNKPWWNLGLASWLGIAALAVVGLFVMTGQVPLSQTDIAWTVYSLDPRTWSAWMTLPLWFVVLVQLIHRRYGADGLFKFSILSTLGLIVTIVGFLLYQQLTMRGVGGQKGTLTKIYNDNIVAPILKTVETGVVDWRILITPVLAAIAVAYIWMLYRYQKKHDIRIEFNPRYDILWMCARILRGLILLVVLGGLVTVIVFMASEMNSQLPMRPNKNPVSVYYHKNVLTPWSDLFNKGTFDRKLFVMPGAGAVLIVLLWSMKSRRKPS